MADFRGPLQLPRVRPVDTRIADEAWLAWVDQGTIIQPRQARGLVWIDPGGLAGFTSAPGPGSNLREALAWRWIAELGTAQLDRERIEQEPGATIRATARVDPAGRRLMVDGSLVVDAGALSLDSIPIWIGQPASAIAGWRFNDESGGERLAVVPIAPAARSKWRFPADGSAWSLRLKAAPQTRKVVGFHGELAWNSGGSIPLLAVSPRYLFRGMISVEAPRAVRYRVKTAGLRRLDASGLDQPQIEADQDIMEAGREERNVSNRIYKYSFAYDKPGGRLELASEPMAPLQLPGIIREAVLTTTVDPNGPLLHRLRLLVHPAEASSLELVVPAPLTLLRIRRDGVEVAAIRSGSNLSIPLPGSSQGPRSSTILIDYLVENTTAGDGSRIRPDIPEVALPCLSFVWEVTAPAGWKAVDPGPGWIVSDREGSSFWPAGALGLWKPEWDIFRGRSRSKDEELLGVLDERLADSVSTELTLAEVLTRWDLGPRSVVIDRVALNASAIGPRSLCIPGRAKAQGRHISLTTLEEHGLALVPFEDAVVITTTGDLPEFDRRDRWNGAITESLAWGSDRADRFQTVVRWREEPSPKTSSTAAEETGERVKRLEGWSTGRFAGASWPRENSFIYLIDVKARIVTGWIIAGTWLMGWLWWRRRVEHGRFVVLAVVTAGSLLFDWLLPTRHASFTAALFIGSLGILMIELGAAAARPHREGHRPIRTESSLARRVAGTAMIAGLVCVLMGSLALGQPAGWRSSAILALYPYEGSFDPGRPPQDVIVRLSDFDRLSRLAEAKAPATWTSVRAVSALHRVRTKSAQNVVVESELELIAAGRAPFQLADSRIAGSRHSSESGRESSSYPDRARRRGRHGGDCPTGEVSPAGPPVGDDQIRVWL